MNHLQSLGPLALASRLRNLSDTLMQGVARIYREMDLDFEPRWFPVTHYLFSYGPVSVTALANALQQTHPAILQVTQTMKEKGLIEFNKDETDQRKTIIEMTPKGQKMAEALAGIWEDIAAAASGLLEENHVDLFNDLARLEVALAREDIYTRIKKEYVRKRLDDLQFRYYSENFFEAYKELNYQWLNETVGISPYDEKFLNNPGEEVMKKGGRIHLAFAGTELVGTVALIPVNKTETELTKLAVKKAYRMMGIGEKIMFHAIDEAKKSGYQTILLLTHTKLNEAIRLYRKLGFEEIPAHPDLPDPTGRCSITMKYLIQH